jgi:agmatinase
MTDFGGALKKGEEYEFAILGVPYDEKSCYLKGPARGPRAIREASTGKALNPWTELGVDLEQDTTLVDLGDVSVDGDASQVFAQIEKAVSRIVEKSAVPIILGGDHSISYPAVKALAKTYPKLDILHFDAHPDLYEEMYGDRYSHACPFARIVEKGLASNLVQVGIRAATGQQLEKAEQFKVHTFFMKDLAELPSLSFKNPLYISFDLDALDPAFAPGVSHHEPGGLSPRQVIQMIHALKASIIGFDIVELNPDRDTVGITAAAAVKILMEIVGKIVFDTSSPVQPA